MFRRCHLACWQKKQIVESALKDGIVKRKLIIALFAKLNNRLCSLLHSYQIICIQLRSSIIILIVSIFIDRQRLADWLQNKVFSFFVIDPLIHDKRIHALRNGVRFCFQNRDKSLRTAEKYGFQALAGLCGQAEPWLISAHFLPAGLVGAYKRSR